MHLFVIDPFALQRLRWHQAALRFEVTLLRCALALKAGYNPDEPRVPAGSPDGGQWTTGGASGPITDFSAQRRSGSGVPETGPKTQEPLRITVYPRSNYDVSGPASESPPLQTTPKIPLQEPDTAQLRNAVIKQAAKWLLKATLRDALGPIGVFINVLEAADWIRRSYPYIQTYLDPPKSLEDLQQAVSTPQKGYDIHHIVEQTSAEQDGFPRDLIDAPENLVRIPTLKHWEITAWYATRNEDYNFMSPRQYLRGKSWSERVRVGEFALRKFGVLKP